MKIFTSYLALNYLLLYGVSIETLKTVVAGNFSLGIHVVVTFVLM